MLKKHGKPYVRSRVKIPTIITFKETWVTKEMGKMVTIGMAHQIMKTMIYRYLRTIIFNRWLMSYHQELGMSLKKGAFVLRYFQKM